MRIYIKGDYTRKVSFGYREPHGKCGLKKEMVKNKFSNVGDDEMLKNDFYLSLRLIRGSKALAGKMPRLKVAVQSIPNV